MEKNAKSHAIALYEINVSAYFSRLSMAYKIPLI